MIRGIKPKLKKKCHLFEQSPTTRGYKSKTIGSMEEFSIRILSDHETGDCRYKRSPF